jgi:cytochrome b involved in lipid metabolism
VTRTPDPCLATVLAHQDFDVKGLLDFFIKFTGLAKKTPQDRIVLATAEELEDLCRRAAEALEALSLDTPAEGGLVHPDIAEAVRTLSQAQASFDFQSPATMAFPAAALYALQQRTHPIIAAEIRRWLDRHQALQKRLEWLLEGTSPDRLAQLDPVRDSDRIYHALMSTFRVESRVLELLAINRISQASALALFIRSTGESEERPVARFYDTYALFANYFEWGEESRRGRAVIDRMNGIHGRYFIPNEGMKYILLQTAFTWIDAAAQIGHRPLTELERLGFFHAHVRMGRAMRIEGLSDDYQTEYRWYRDFNQAHRATRPLKRDTFETFVGHSLGESTPEPLREGLFLAARVAMDDDYRAALGYDPPTAEQTQAVRAIFFTLGQLVAQLPPTAYLRSLQNNPHHSRYTRPDELGVSSRSRHLPSVAPHPPRSPLTELPFKTAELSHESALPVLSWEEIRSHSSEKSLWVVLDGEVYDLTRWAHQHPGGLHRLLQYAGKDASEAFRQAPHSFATQVFKLNYRVGRAPPELSLASLDRAPDVPHTQRQS